MALDHERLLTLQLPDRRQGFSRKDAIFYALSIGIGTDPLDPDQLKFVYEKQLQAFPAIAHILAMETDWIFDPANGLDLTRLLHLDSGLTMHQPLPSAGTLNSKMRISAVHDQGEGRGAIVRFDRDLYDVDRDLLCATVTGAFYLRGQGGFGGAAPPPSSAPVVPDRAPDASCDLATHPEAALLYRLNHDMNPIHVDPAIARAAGFERPLLHGACTYAIACHAFVRSLCGYDAARLRRFDARFSAPVFPGDTLRTDFWAIGDNRFAFTCRAVERDMIVLNSGLAAHY
jgi:acyl dehydratase